MMVMVATKFPIRLRVEPRLGVKSESVFGFKPETLPQKEWDRAQCEVLCLFNWAKQSQNTSHLYRIADSCEELMKYSDHIVDKLSRIVTSCCPTKPNHS